MNTLIPILLALVILNSVALAVLLIRSYQNFSVTTGSKQQKKIIVDTCALIDGRLIEVMRAGFVPGQLLIPQAVIAELQHLADLPDAHKRERARFGLDIVRELQALSDNGVVIISTPKNTDMLVDDLLVELARRHDAMLYTTDYNLNKVAEIKGVRVLNINELAQGLRARYLPGEAINIKLVQKGQDSSQAVGYLLDGTMVVVEKAGGKVGQSVDVIFTRVLQTQAGKMMFGQLINKGSFATKTNHSKQPKQRQAAHHSHSEG